MSRLLATCAVLLVVVQAVTLQAVSVSQMQSETKKSSTVVSSAAEATDKADAEFKTSFMRKSPFSEDRNDTIVQEKKNGTKVDIDVYYETRCPGCLLFLNQTLAPMWTEKKNRDIFNVNLYTYGNGMTIPTKNISDGYKFWHPESTGAGWDSVIISQHGADEGLGNLVQVCAKNTTDHEKHMDLVFCMASATISGFGVEKATYECMDKVGVDKDKVKECVTSPMGNKLLSEVGDKTHSLKDRKGTPWVLVGGEHVADQVLMNSTLLLQSVCQKAVDAPVICEPFKGSPAVAAAPAQPVDPDFTVLQDIDDAEDLLQVSRV